MKDNLFTPKKKNSELMYFGVCLLLAILLNIFSIIFYGSEWKEIYTQWFYVLVLTMAFHYATILFRLIFVGWKKNDVA